MTGINPSLVFLKEFPRVWRTRAGKEIVIRPIWPEDAEIERRFVHDLSPKSKYQRFLMAVGDLTPAMVERFTNVDYRRDMALIATTQASRDHSQG